MFSSLARVAGARKKLAVVNAAILALSACASLQPKAPEAEVQERAQARWHALIGSDFERAWTYTDKATQERVQQGEYKKTFGGPGVWKEMSVHSVQCQPQMCIARVRVTARNFMPTLASTIPTVTTYSDEIWVREDGQWRYQGLKEAAVGGATGQ